LFFAGNALKASHRHLPRLSSAAPIVVMALLVLLPCSGHSQVAAPAKPPAPAQAATAHAHAASGAGHTHRALHRSAHLSRIQERLAGPGHEPAQHCRFESEINTPAPPKLLALTFDDGPEAGQTEHIVAVLKRHQVPATFFVIGAKAKRHPELLALVQALPGARVGNHTWSHANFHHLPVAAQLLEIERNDALLTEALATQPEPVKLFRYPFGNASCEANARVHALGYRIVGWHVDSCDWAFDDDGAVDAHEALGCGVLAPFHRDFIGHVLSATRAHHGGIVLMHENRPNTVHQLDRLITRLKAEGYAFTTPDDPAFSASLR
jgi:peptidoglycan-N-acetylglucosamine deacetylase